MFEFLLVLLIVIVLFGATRLPALGSGLGKAVRSFRQASGSEPRPGQDAPKPGDPPPGR